MNKSPITTHVLDTVSGQPASGVCTQLSFCSSLSQSDTVSELFSELAKGVTDDDGRIFNFLSYDTPLTLGVYRLRFELESYFKSVNRPCFYPYADIVFHVHEEAHFHIPLLLSTYGYSTYRGS